MHYERQVKLYHRLRFVLLAGLVGSLAFSFSDHSFQRTLAVVTDVVFAYLLGGMVTAHRFLREDLKIREMLRD